MNLVHIARGDAERTARVVARVEDETHFQRSGGNFGESLPWLYGEIWDTEHPADRAIKKFDGNVWPGRFISRDHATIGLVTTPGADTIWITHFDAQGQDHYHNGQPCSLLPLKRGHDVGGDIRDLYLGVLPPVEFPGKAAETIAAGGSGDFEIDPASPEVFVDGVNDHMANGQAVEIEIEGTVRWNRKQLRWDIVHAACSPTT